MHDDHACCHSLCFAEPEAYGPNKLTNSQLVINACDSFTKRCLITRQSKNLKRSHPGPNNMSYSSKQIMKQGDHKPKTQSATEGGTGRQYTLLHRPGNAWKLANTHDSGGLTPQQQHPRRQQQQQPSTRLSAPLAAHTSATCATRQLLLLASRSSSVASRSGLQHRPCAAATAAAATSSGTLGHCWL
jgi:hypothetical protein